MELPRPGTIDLWLWNLDVTVDRLAALAATLSPDERRRRDRFYFSREATRFVAARGQLRAIVAEYLQLDADAVRFEYNEYGKPSLRRAGVTPPIWFNLTHSDGLAALAVASDRAVGVDIERMRIVAEDMTNWIMTDAEKRCFRSLPPELRRDAFFRCWTRKEAVLKAMGHGFSLSPGSLEVSFGINGHSWLRRIGDDRLSTQVWRVADFTPVPGYAGAIAAQGPPWTLRLRQAPLIAENGDGTEQNPLSLVCMP